MRSFGCPPVPCFDYFFHCTLCLFKISIAKFQHNIFATVAFRAFDIHIHRCFYCSCWRSAERNSSNRFTTAKRTRFQFSHLPHLSCQHRSRGRSCSVSQFLRFPDNSTLPRFWGIRGKILPRFLFSPNGSKDILR